MNNDPQDAETLAPKRQRERRFSMSGLLLFGLPIAMVLLGTFAVVMARDRLPSLSESAFVTARDRWDEMRSADYDMEIEIGGAMPGIVQIEVRSGIVNSMRRDGQTPKDKRTWAVWTVDGQFEMIDRELDIADNPVREIGARAGTRIELRAQFDRHFGHPVGFRRLVMQGKVPEVQWRVVRFEPK